MVDYYNDLRDSEESIGSPKSSENFFDYMIKLRENDVSFKDWVVYKNGDMNNIENSYPIEHDRLTENQWISHMRSKSWVDMNTFIDAYIFALVRTGHDELTIKLHL